MTTPDFRLDGKVAVVTGASKGIGRGLAPALAGAGARVALVSRDISSLERLTAEIASSGGEAAGFALDVRDVAAIGQVFDEEVSEAAWDEMMVVNLKGAFFVAQAAGRIMLSQGEGRIVNMSSQAGSVGIRDHAVYCATKGGVEQFTRVLALEWGQRGVTVNAVAPTFIRTPGTAERLDQPDYLKSVLDRIPIGRVGTIDDVAGAVIYLASPAGGMVNGEVLKVDGGWTAQ